jgi:hypothetical protein
MSPGKSMCLDLIYTANVSFSGTRSSQRILWPWCQTRKTQYTGMVGVHAQTLFERHIH